MLERRGMNDRLQQFASSFIESTRDYIFVRPEDNLLILRPNRVHHLNATATVMLRWCTRLGRRMSKLSSGRTKM